MRNLLTRPGLLAASLALAMALVACSDRGGEPPRSPAFETPETTAAATQPTETAATATATRTASATLPSGTLSIADLVELAEPAIVRIESGGGVGTGFIVGSEGYIVTNNHVVESAAATIGTVNVTLSDGEILSGAIVGTDPRSDLALVKIEGGPYSALELGSLEEVRIGEEVVAIGYALDLSQGEGPSFSVTSGIISQKNRAISESAPILGAIQTDAAINHGNSGGPLLNLRGQVVGVNTALAPDPTRPNQVAQGIGFAVGVDTVKAVWEQLRDDGVVRRGLLGVRGFTALRPAQARDLGIPEDQGGIYLASPDSVEPGGPAARAGIQPGDVITKVGDFAVNTEADLAVAMIKNPPGTTLDVELFRGPERMTVSVTLGTPSQ